MLNVGYIPLVARPCALPYGGAFIIYGSTISLGAFSSGSDKPGLFAQALLDVSVAGWPEASACRPEPNVPA